VLTHIKLAYIIPPSLQYNTRLKFNDNQTIMQTPSSGCTHPDWRRYAATLSLPTAKFWHFGIMAYSLLPWYR